MKPEDVGNIRKVKGIDELILGVDPWGGFTSIDVDKLTMKMKNLSSEEALAEMEADMPVGFREMSFIAVIKSDIANKDKLGWKQHRKALKDGGFDA